MVLCMLDASLKSSAVMLEIPVVGILSTGTFCPNPSLASSEICGWWVRVRVGVMVSVECNYSSISICRFRVGLEIVFRLGLQLGLGLRLGLASSYNKIDPQNYACGSSFP